MSNLANKLTRNEGTNKVLRVFHTHTKTALLPESGFLFIKPKRLSRNLTSNYARRWRSSRVTRQMSSQVLSFTRSLVL